MARCTITKKTRQLVNGRSLQWVKGEPCHELLKLQGEHTKHSEVYGTHQYMNEYIITKQAGLLNSYTVEACNDPNCIVCAMNYLSCKARRVTGHTHKHTQQEQHNTRHDENNTTNDHTENHPPALNNDRRWSYQTASSAP